MTSSSRSTYGSAVRLCPALGSGEWEPPRRNRAEVLIDAGPDYGFYANDTAWFTVRPDELGRIDDMFVSDPPAARALIFLAYKHVETSFRVSILYTSTQGSKLTFRSIFEQARSVQGKIETKQGNISSRRAPLPKIFYNVTLDAVMSQYTSIHGGSFQLDLKTCWINLKAIVPTEEEWETMRQVLAEEEEKKKLMDPDEHAVWIAKLLRD